MNKLQAFFPFLRWFPLSRGQLRADAVAGITVALVLVPQSMAYAQLAGLPPYYGLYAAFLPVLIGAMWGSSHQLATGPVAMVSLLTGSTLAQFAAPGTEQFIALAITLALMAGVMQLALGAFRLGAIVNFVSHPVIVGFTNAAAIIIALSQLNKMLGVSLAHGEHFVQDIWGVLQQVGDTHWPTLAMGAGAFVFMWLVRVQRPHWPGVLIAVTLCTALSWAIDFERRATADISHFADGDVRNVIEYVMAASNRIRELDAEIRIKADELDKLRKQSSEVTSRILVLNADLEILRLDLRTLEREHRLRLRELRRFALLRADEPSGNARFHLEGSPPAAQSAGGRHWRVARVSGTAIELSGGGEVVGTIPPGLPALTLPRLNWDMLSTLVASALVISLVGFMEAISIAKAMATRTRQRIDPNQELIGQGLANVLGSLSQSFPVSGSFSRSAVNLQAGAVTGVSSVVTGVIVLITLLLFTPLLYHLPQAVLAAVIMMAVVNLVNFKAMRHAWRAHRHDGIAATVTFTATLALAPHLDTGILVGAGLAVVLYLYRTMHPRVVILGRHPDGTLRDARLHQLPLSEHIIAIRFDGSLYFANVPYFEDAILGEVARRPKAKFVLVVGDAINEIDASGEEVIRHLVERLRENGVTVVFSGLKLQVLQVMEHTALQQMIGEENLFRTEHLALEAIYRRITDPAFDAATCPLRQLGPPATATG